MDDEQREMLAQDIVALSAAALRDLNDGKSVPAKWAAAMQSALKPRRKSGPPGLTDRGMTLARLKRDKMLGRDGRTDEQLAELRNTDKRELHRQYRKHFVPVYVEELENRPVSYTHLTLPTSDLV